MEDIWNVSSTNISIPDIHNVHGRPEECICGNVELKDQYTRTRKVM